MRAGSLHPKHTFPCTWKVTQSSPSAGKTFAAPRAAPPAAGPRPPSPGAPRLLARPLFHASSRPLPPHQLSLLPPPRRRRRCCRRSSARRALGRGHRAEGGRRGREGARRGRRPLAAHFRPGGGGLHCRVHRSSSAGKSWGGGIALCPTHLPAGRLGCPLHARRAVARLGVGCGATGDGFPSPGHCGQLCGEGRGGGGRWFWGEGRQRSSWGLCAVERGRWEARPLGRCLCPSPEPGMLLRGRQFPGTLARPGRGRAKRRRAASAPCPAAARGRGREALGALALLPAGEPRSLARVAGGRAVPPGRAGGRRGQRRCVRPSVRAVPRALAGLRRLPAAGERRAIYTPRHPQREQLSCGRSPRASLPALLASEPLRLGEAGAAGAPRGTQLRRCAWLPARPGEAGGRCGCRFVPGVGGVGWVGRGPG